MKVHFLPSYKPSKRMMAIFTQEHGHPIIIHFGEGCAYTLHKDKNRRDLYNSRFSRINIYDRDVNMFNPEVLNRYIFNGPNTDIKKNQSLYRYVFDLQ